MAFCMRSVFGISSTDSCKHGVYQAIGISAFRQWMNKSAVRSAYKVSFFTPSLISPVSDLYPYLSGPVSDLYAAVWKDSLGGVMMALTFLPKAVSFMKSSLNLSQVLWSKPSSSESAAKRLYSHPI